MSATLSQRRERFLARSLGKGSRPIRKTCLGISPKTSLLAERTRSQRHDAVAGSSGLLRVPTDQVRSLFTMSNTRRSAPREPTNPKALFKTPDRSNPRPQHQDHHDLVEPDGIEPTTSCLQSRRS